MTRGHLLAALVLAAAATLLGAALAPAATVDCRKAGNTSEGPSCGDNRLSMLDSRMGALYQEALKAPHLDREYVRSDQRRWLRRRNRECGAERDPYYCLGSHMEERIRFLEGLLY
jgi:uncharacterized protein